MADFHNTESFLERYEQTRTEILGRQSPIASGGGALKAD